MSDDKCAHCRGTVRGFAAVNENKLCHPDEGMDCYHLVTVYGHEMPCARVDVDLILTAMITGESIQVNLTNLPAYLDDRMPFTDDPDEYWRSRFGGL